MSVKKINIVPSLIDTDTYFIFRRSGEEVRFVLKNDLIVPDKKLLLQEVNLIRRNYINYKPLTSIQDLVCDLTYKGYTDKQISDRTGLSLQIVGRKTREFWINKTKTA